MRRGVLLLLVLLLVACGGDRKKQRGNVGWDAGTAVVEITGRGAYVLELDNNGSVVVDLYGPGDVEPSPFAPGGSMRVKGSGPAAYRFRHEAGRQAYVDYRLEGDDGVFVDSRIE